MPDKELDMQDPSEIRIVCNQHNGTKSEILHTIFLVFISILIKSIKLARISVFKNEKFTIIIVYIKCFAQSNL